MSRILVTGGAGFIGSHTSLTLLLKGYKIVILDNFSNSNEYVIDNIKNIISKNNRELLDNIQFKNGDIRDSNTLSSLFEDCKLNGDPINAVIHFAGYKAARESVDLPIKYWENNVSGTINLLKYMNKYLCKTIIFSSSASVYGNSNKKFIDENEELRPINPYAYTKFVIENFLRNIYTSNQHQWRIANLRYFNPIGAHSSGMLGESPIGIPNNVFPKLVEVAANKISKLKVFGNDWSTPDGTGVRDYIHVMDIAEGHTAALDYLMNLNSKFINLNLGTGRGYSVLELINAFSKINNLHVPYEFVSKRDGDVARLVADNRLAISLLKWKPIRDINDMCRDGWRWNCLRGKVN
tara:strand:- start:271 stop:1323 length:1053 start_codon:yes stop_codon:yes gene_type:complete